jgi:Protein of unknown function (DUF3102)
MNIRQQGKNRRSQCVNVESIVVSVEAPANPRRELATTAAPTAESSVRTFLLDCQTAETARTINELHRSIVSSVQSAVRIGEMLTKIKESLPHGEWLPWVTKNLEFCDRTARRYIRLWEQRAKLDIVSDLGMAAAFRLLAANPKREDPANSASLNGDAAQKSPPTALDPDDLRERFDARWPKHFEAFLRCFNEENRAEIIDLAQMALMNLRSELDP